MKKPQNLINDILSQNVKVIKDLIVGKAYENILKQIKQKDDKHG
jgi:hypothetical protein